MSNSSFHVLLSIMFLLSCKNKKLLSQLEKAKRKYMLDQPVFEMKIYFGILDCASAHLCNKSVYTSTIHDHMSLKSLVRVSVSSQETLAHRREVKTFSFPSFARLHFCARNSVAQERAKFNLVAVIDKRPSEAEVYRVCTI